MTAVQHESTTVTPVILSPVALRNALSACLLAASHDDTLPVLAAVQVAKTGDQLAFRATDRYRLMVVTIKLDNPPEGDWETLIPAADVKRAVAALPKTLRESVLATIAPDAIDFLSGSMRFTPQDGEYPKVAQLIPTDTAPVDEISLNPKHLADLAKMPGRQKNEPANFKFNGPNKPVLSEWGDEDISYKCLLMPVRLRS